MSDTASFASDTWNLNRVDVDDLEVIFSSSGLEMSTDARAMLPWPTDMFVDSTYLEATVADENFINEQRMHEITRYNETSLETHPLLGPSENYELLDPAVTAKKKQLTTRR